MVKGCSFCTLPEIKERTILRNELAFAFLTYIPIVLGHILISPVRCVAKFDDFPYRTKASSKERRQPEKELKEIVEDIKKNW